MNSHDLLLQLSQNPTIYGLLCITVGIIYGWMLHKNRHEILRSLKDFTSLLLSSFETVYHKMPAMKTHQKQYWISFAIIVTITFVPNLFGADFLTNCLWTAVAYGLAFPAIYILFVRLSDRWKERNSL